jgi:hypothetical protein
MIPASGRAKTVHALDRSATVTGYPFTVVNKMVAICVNMAENRNCATTFSENLHISKNNLTKEFES